MKARRSSILAVMLRFLLLWALGSLVEVAGGGKDLYAVLGVSRGAEAAEIKQAYRRRARETHPDKNPKLDAATTAAAFNEVADAYAILSDDTARRRYDLTGSRQQSQSGDQQRGWGQAGGFHFSYNSAFRVFSRRPHERAEVKEAQAEVVTVTSLLHLDTLVGDEAMERTLVIAFCQPPNEKVVDEQVLYPFPFGGNSYSGLSWEDHLTFGKVRFNSKHEVAAKFGVRPGREPVFVAVRAGQRLEEFTALSTSRQKEFELWVWKLLEVRVWFKNEHTHDVTLYWLDGQRAQRMANIPPGQQVTQTTMLSHSWWVRDARVTQHQLREGTCLGRWTVSSQHEQVFTIRTRSCVDDHGECEFWAGTGECGRNPSYMRANCRRACQICRDEGANASHSNWKDEL